MYGLAKVAGEHSNLHKEASLKNLGKRIKELDEKLSNKISRKFMPKDDMTPSERDELLELLKDKYGVKANFQYIDKSEGAKFSHRSYLAKKMKEDQEILENMSPDDESYDFQKSMSELTEILHNGTIFASNRRATILHEAGHSVDPLVYNDKLHLLTDLIDKYSLPATAVLGGGSAAVAYQLNKKEDRSNILGNVVMGVGGMGAAAISLAKPLLLEVEERNADRFVDQVLKDTLKDPKKIKEAIKGRKYARGTYHLNTIANLSKPVMMGVAGYNVPLFIDSVKDEMKKLREEMDQSEEGNG